MSDRAYALTETVWSACGGDHSRLDTLSLTSEGALPSAFFVTDFASATIAAAALALDEWIDSHSEGIVIDRRLASMWFYASIRPQGWMPPAPWDALAGDYRAQDGWIRLHTNAPAHRAAAQRVLGPHADKQAMASAVSRWNATELEQAIVEAGGCAAQMHSVAEWSDHPQGRAVNAEPLIHNERGTSAADGGSAIDALRPLAGIRVLDLTRVLAGPVATRFLAGWGAEVLRIDPPDWDEPALIPEVTPGKRCARLDLRSTGDRAIFESLLATSDVLIHGYRTGALDRLGYDAETRQRLRPGLVDVSLNAYGATGPWSGRRGFDSLVQMSTGIAHDGMDWRGAEQPVPLPVQALDHGTGYVMAAAALRGLAHRRRDGFGCITRLSLARTAKLLLDLGRQSDSSALAPETELDRAPDIETTAWGPAQRLISPVSMGGLGLHFSRPASALGSSTPAWQAP
ncbi:CoA transferase [Dyella sp. GSA-30]|uniref:CoA transferase n=1 Tax=Dyella sp. GSA-30 TaxID=2994496 RepID=UPI0024939142|nr:CoA transferase [Dyella sp. GSA-30]BDU21938.1 coa transferase caib/baif family protein [Dyella sp. GSA-30]